MNVLNLAKGVVFGQIGIGSIGFRQGSDRFG